TLCGKGRGRILVQGNPALAGSGFAFCFFVFVKYPFELENIENELKKRHRFPYKWFRVQNDIWDNHTRFIYDTPNWEKLVEKIGVVSKTPKWQQEQFFQYAANRWYNFWSAKAVERIFSEMEGVKSVSEAKDA